MIRLRDLSLRPDEGEAALLRRAAKMLRVPAADITALKIRKKSIDARKKPDIRIIYTVDVAVRGNARRLAAHAGSKASLATDPEYLLPLPKCMPRHRPVVVGFGPAGLFAALLLARAGLRPLVLERGLDVDQRMEKVQRFWRTGELDSTCNVQFGEGGAGTFSDGKLNTGIKNERIAFVLETLHQAGASEAIVYDARPHIGTDVLCGVVRHMREEIISLGGEVRFGAAVVGLQQTGGRITGLRLASGGFLTCDQVILAVGHSARDTFEMLHAAGVPMAPKPFSMGVRIEHPQALIDAAQYGAFPERNILLPPADYHLSCHFPEGDSAYTFCMCPGGYVVAAASELGGVVTNGMSESRRDGENANAALLVTLKPERFPDSTVLSGMYWQREIERRAFQAGGETYRAPAQLVGDFLSGRASTGPGRVLPTYRPGVTWCDLHAVLPPVITATLEKAIPALGKRLRGFDDPDAVLTAPETRSSSPVRILRGENLQSALTGLYPCGEGAGYAGGIVSAAVDGMRCAEALIAAIPPLVDTDLPVW